MSAPDDESTGRVTVEGRVYTIGALIGRGRTADVHQLEPVEGQTGPALVLKRRVDRAGASAGREISVDEFAREVETLEALRAAAEGDADEHFPRVRAVDPEGEWFAMDRALGLPLEAVVGRTLLTVEQIVSVCRQLVEALVTARAAGLRNTDLKLDAIFYDQRDDHVVVIDWNVCAPWAPVEDAWIDPHAALVARVLDGLLRHKMTDEGGTPPDWSRRFSRPPARWAHYPRVFQSALTALLSQTAQVSLDDVREPLNRIAEVLAKPREALLDEVLAQLARSQLDPVAEVEQVREALGWTQLVMQSPRQALALKGRAALQGVIALLGRDAMSIARLWRSFDEADAEVHVPPGDTPDLARLRRLVAVRREAFGLGERLREIAEAFAALDWSRAARVLRRIDAELSQHERLAAQLEPLADEAAALSRVFTAMQALDRLVPGPDGETDVELRSLDAQAKLRQEVLRDVEAAIEQLDRVPWSAQLFRGLPEILAMRDALATLVEQEQSADTSGARRSLVDAFDPRVAASSGRPTGAPADRSTLIDFEAPWLSDPSDARRATPEPSPAASVEKTGPTSPRAVRRAIPFALEDDDPLDGVDELTSAQTALHDQRSLVRGYPLSEGPTDFDDEPVDAPPRKRWLLVALAATALGAAAAALLASGIADPSGGADGPETSDPERIVVSIGAHAPMEVAADAGTALNTPVDSGATLGEPDAQPDLGVDVGSDDKGLHTQSRRDSRADRQARAAARAKAEQLRRANELTRQLNENAAAGIDRSGQVAGGAGVGATDSASPGRRVPIETPRSGERPKSDPKSEQRPKPGSSLPAGQSPHAEPRPEPGRTSQPGQGPQAGQVVSPGQTPKPGQGAAEPQSEPAKDSVKDREAQREVPSKAGATSTGGDQTGDDSPLPAADAIFDNLGSTR